MRKIRIGTRGSRLALAQVREIINLLPEARYSLEVFETRGDKDKATPIDQVEGSDFFTDSIEKALLEGKIDLAIHSAKDLPEQINEGLMVALTTGSIDADDALVSRKGLKFLELPVGAKVGTSSRRRKEQLLAKRKDLQILDLRGNIEERLRKLDRGEFEAIVIAAAALIRLGLAERITERLPFETAKGQGSLAVEVRNNNEGIIKWLRKSI